jgi:2-(1,2-epoxy-1,2-dihydrophenyl)acetyl-CoA isomerase
MGLVNKVVPADDLDAAVMDWAEKLSNGPSFAYGWTKKLIDQSFNSDIDKQLEAERDGIVSCAGSADMQEGIRAFVEKRRAEFSGE